MPKPPERNIREVLLEVVMEAHNQRRGGNLQQTSILDAVSQRLGITSTNPSSDFEEAVLSEWQELFRTGILAWGYNLNNPNPPFLHVTARGRQALERLSRDPSNKAGYLRHLELRASLGSISRSYITEALDCYVAGLFKASAVMVGAAAESTILELRDMVVAKLADGGKGVPKPLESWQTKTVTDALTKIFDVQIDKSSHRALREQYDMYWSGFAGQLRTTRNDAGHPTSIDPVTFETVHASLLIFPEFAALSKTLWTWAADHL